MLTSDVPMSSDNAGVDRRKPTVIIVIGMAGSGKTTMMKALHAHFSRPSPIAHLPINQDLPKVAKKSDNGESEMVSTQRDSKESADAIGDEKPMTPALLEMPETRVEENVNMEDVPQQASSSSASCSMGQKSESVFFGDQRRKKLKTYIINLDPAVRSTPYPVNIDIRDTINYKQVMKEYKLGPNGAIMTALNLFATKFDQVLELLEKRSNQLDIILVDTPGQIEAFNWSASGSIILDSLAVSFPTMVLYIVDTPRCKSPITFMSNMIYACSVLYKSKLPFIMVFNKTDVRSSDECFKWMQSYNDYADDLLNEGSYMASLSRSCALVMNEFYEGIRSVGVSAAHQLGLVQLETCINESREEYFTQYLQWLTEQRAVVIKRREKLAEQSAKKFTDDRKYDEEQRKELEELRAKMQGTTIKPSDRESVKDATLKEKFTDA